MGHAAAFLTSNPPWVRAASPSTVQSCATAWPEADGPGARCGTVAVTGDVPLPHGSWHHLHCHGTPNCLLEKPQYSPIPVKRPVHASVEPTNVQQDQAFGLGMGLWTSVTHFVWSGRAPCGQRTPVELGSLASGRSRTPVSFPGLSLSRGRAPSVCPAEG